MYRLHVCDKNPYKLVTHSNNSKKINMVSVNITFLIFTHISTRWLSKTGDDASRIENIWHYIIIMTALSPWQS